MPQVIKKINRDSMWIKVKFVSGSSFKFKATRYDQSIEMTFASNNDPKPHMVKFMDWVSKHKTTSYGTMFKKIETLAEGCSTMRSFMKLLKD